MKRLNSIHMAIVCLSSVALFLSEISAIPVDIATRNDNGDFHSSESKGRNNAESTNNNNNGRVASFNSDTNEDEDSHIDIIIIPADSKNNESATTTSPSLQDITSPQNQETFVTNNDKFVSSRIGKSRRSRSATFSRPKSRSRSRRSSCRVTAQSRVVDFNASQVIDVLNASTYLGFDPVESDGNMTLGVKRGKCANEADCKWWYDEAENEDRHKALCPWDWRKKDLGVDMYPRYVKEAECLCQYCMGDGLQKSCNSLKRSITVFQKIGCHQGLAVMTKIEKSIRVGCYCENPGLNSD